MWRAEKIRAKTSTCLLQGIGGKADEVEVPLHEVQDHGFPHHLEQPNRER